MTQREIKEAIEKDGVNKRAEINSVTTETVITRSTK